MVTDAENLTFSLTLSASDNENLHLRNCISAIPVTEPSTPVSRSVDGKKLTRKISLKIARPPSIRSSRLVWLFTMLFWLTTAGAAILAAHAMHRWQGAVERTAVTRDRRGALGYVQGGVASSVPFGLRADGLATLGPDLVASARYGLAEASQRHGAAINAHKEQLNTALQSLRLQLSPLAALAEDTPNLTQQASIPKTPVAAMGLARAAIQALSAPMEAMAEDDGPVAVEAEAAPVAAGFDQPLAMRCAQLCLSTYHSAEDEAAASERIADDMRHEATEAAAGGGGEVLRLVAEVSDEATDTYALLTRNSSHLFVAFRGSCTARNVLTDIDFEDDGEATATYARNCGLPSDSMALHRGFLEAYRALRPALVRAIEAELDASDGAVEGSGSSLGLVLTGHSMGGAMAMLAALDLGRHSERLRPVTTYTFAAPRVGDARFARLFSQTFPSAASHWALQAEADAVPHLPFKAWGFEHPQGVAVISDEAGSCLRRTGDRGDSVRCMRPREGNAANWATCHDLEFYMQVMRNALGDHAFSGSSPIAAVA